MKICVMSDTHGVIDNVIHHLKTHAYDEVWHLGDYVLDAQAIGEKIDVRIVPVKGNCDIYHQGDDIVSLEREGVNILLVHGHEHGVKYGLNKLYYTAAEGDYQLVCFGHTHVAVNTEASGVHLLNPGSPSKPRGIDPPSIGVVEINNGEVSCRILWV